MPVFFFQVTLDVGWYQIDPFWEGFIDEIRSALKGEEPTREAEVQAMLVLNNMLLEHWL